MTIKANARSIVASTTLLLALAHTTTALAEPPTAEEIMAFCRARLAHYKCPRKVIFTTLPRTSTGKIQKRLLRDTARGTA